MVVEARVCGPGALAGAADLVRAPVGWDSSGLSPHGAASPLKTHTINTSSPLPRLCLLIGIYWNRSPQCSVCSPQRPRAVWGLSASPALFSRLCPLPNQGIPLCCDQDGPKDLLETTLSLEGPRKACVCGRSRGTQVRDRLGGASGLQAKK